MDNYGELAGPQPISVVSEHHREPLADPGHYCGNGARLRGGRGSLLTPLLV